MMELRGSIVSKVAELCSPEEDRGRLTPGRPRCCCVQAHVAKRGAEAQPCCPGCAAATAEAPLACSCTHTSLKDVNNLLLNIPMLIAWLHIYPALCHEPKPLTSRPELLILTPSNRWKLHKWEKQIEKQTIPLLHSLWPRKDILCKGELSGEKSQFLQKSMYL